MLFIFDNLIDPFAPHTTATPPRKLLRFIYFFAKPILPQIVWLMFLGVTFSLVEVMLQIYLGRIIDALNVNNPKSILTDHFLIVAGAGVFLIILRPLVTLLNDATIGQTFTPGLTNRIIWQCHCYVLRQSLNFFSSDFAGRMASRVIQTGLAVREVIVKGAGPLWFVIFFSLSATVSCFDIDYRLAIPLLFWNAGFFLILLYMVPKIGSCSTRVSSMRSLFSGNIVDSYSNIKTVKAFTLEESEQDFVKYTLSNHTKLLQEQMHLVTVLNSAIMVLNGGMIFATGLIAVWFWSEERISIGTVAFICGITLRVSTMSGWTMQQAISIFENIGQIQEGMETVCRPIELLDDVEATDLKVDQGEIRFQNVSFDYGKKRAERGTISDLSFLVKPGEKVGIVGRSGAGKSTIVNLLLRFYEIESGSIIVDGQDISGVTQRSLRKQIALVSQDVNLLHRSIAENIRQGRGEATTHQIIEAARGAYAHDFIEKLFDSSGNVGYDVQVGERGVKLSGGQRQRIAIARMLLKNSPILVLDEATSALDSETEDAIENSISALMEGKTVIAIAHRLSTLAAMDRLIVIDSGKIVESGSHNDLLKTQGLYASFWKRQSRGFIGIE